jgi:stringent starvation protein B
MPVNPVSFLPYLLRAVYEWIVDDQRIPYLEVDTSVPGIMVPKQFAQQKKIVFNINNQAVDKLRIGNDAIEFHARFGPQVEKIFIPMPAVRAIFAKDDLQGIYCDQEKVFFNISEELEMPLEEEMIPLAPEADLDGKKETEGKSNLISLEKFKRKKSSFKEDKD